MVLGCDVPELLELVEYALDPIAVLMCPEFAGESLFAACLGRDDRHYTLEQQAGTDIGAVIVFVGQHDPWAWQPARR